MNASAAARLYLDTADEVAPGLVEGLYVVGSYALGDWIEGTSDLDVVVVTAEPATEDDFTRIAQIHARLATVEARIRQLDPPSRGDGAVVNVPLARRMPTDNQIAELARLVHERDRLRAEVGA